MTLSLQLLKLASLASVALGMGAMTLFAARADGAMRAYRRYTASLERRMRLLFIEAPAQHILLAQAAGTALVLAAALALNMPALCLLLVLVAVAPSWKLEQMRKERVARIEAHLDAFVTALANALRATPSAGRALAIAHGVTPAPLDREIELVLREMKVGSTLEQALSNMCVRVGSFQLDAAVAGLLIGRKTGGEVPRILDSTAETLREMARLSGVLRAKTADGRAQAKVLALFPVALIVMFDYVSPGYFAPLTETGTGLFIAVIALVLWLTSILLVRRIMEAQL